MKINLFNFFKKSGGKSNKSFKRRKTYSFYCWDCDYSWQADEPYSRCPQCAAVIRSKDGGK